MAAVLNDKTKEKIRDEVKRLLGRAYYAFPMPLSEEEVEQWWHANFDDQEIPRAYTTLVNAQYSLYVSSDTYTATFTSHLRKPITLHFKGQKLLINYRQQQMPLELGDALTRIWPFGQERWNQLTHWMEVTAQINAEFTGAYFVAHWLLEHCNTAGQINRALPELANYLSPEARGHLANQKRASNMPYEWAPYPKEQVSRAAQAFLKASLMKSCDRAEFLDLEVNWCTFEE